MSNSATIYPFFRYNDAHAAVQFLCDAFGFKQQMSVPDDQGGISHAELSLGGAMIMVGSGNDDSDAEPSPDIRDVKRGLYVAIEDADAHCELARAAGARIVRELEDTDYGSREYSALDPGGYYWSFGTYRPVAE
jgi:uncharacterized glyoxalase superfamily protein PhnB